MNLKSIYQRFRKWQREPFSYETKPGVKYHCANCGNTFEGNFCPACGQRFSVFQKDLTPEEKKDPTLIWGFEADTLLSFLVQLIGRPGYLISDYINGRQRVCGDPINMLCYVAIGTMLVNGLTGNVFTDKSLAWEEAAGIPAMVLTWLASHMDWAILIQTLLLIPPTWLVFRHAPRNSRHSWVDGFNIQVFMSSLVLICVLLRSFVGEWELSLIPLAYFVAYRQLFGYGIWGTLWRTLLSIGSVFYLFGVLMMAWMYLSGKYSTIHSVKGTLGMVAVLIILGAGLLFLGWWIGKITARERNQ